MKGEEFSGRLKIVEEWCAEPAFSLSVGSKETRFANINLDMDRKCCPDVVGNATHLPFRERAFERVLFTEVIEHLPQKDEVSALREIFRVLKEEGELILSTPNDVFLYTILDPARYVMTHRHYKMNYICELVETCGFEILECFTSGSYWECLNNLYYCLITYPAKKVARLRIPFAPSFMLRLANSNYHRADCERGYTIFIRAIKEGQSRN